MDDGEVGDQPDVAQLAEPEDVLLAELGAGPVDGRGGVRVEALEGGIYGAVFVVVPLDHGHVHLADHVEALLGVRVVADHIAEAGVVSHLVGLCIRQHSLETLPVGVDVGDDRVFH